MANRIWLPSRLSTRRIFIVHVPPPPSPSFPFASRFSSPHDPHPLTFLSSSTTPTTLTMSNYVSHDRTLLALTAISTDFPVSTGTDALYPPKRSDAIHPSPIVTGTYPSVSPPFTFPASSFHTTITHPPYIYTHRAPYTHLYRHHPQIQRFPEPQRRRLPCLYAPSHF